MDAAVLIVGAGPVGLTLAAELARHGVGARIIDKQSAPSTFCRAIGVTPRSLEMFEDMGVAREMVDAGLWLDGVRMVLPGQPARDMTRDLSDLPYGALGVPQYETERVLTDHLARFGIVPERGVALAGLAQVDNAVQVELDGPHGREAASFRFVVGCDGAHSAVRKALDIPFEGEAWPFEFMLGDVSIAWDVPRGMAVFAVHPVDDAPPDLFVAVPLPERGRYRVSAMAPAHLTASADVGTDHGIQADRAGASLADLQEVADRLLPERVVLDDLRWSSLFRISMRLAAHYGQGNVFIAGDACHIHPPTGGQGMNTGVQDAYNLAWKLALVVKGDADPRLLDSYESERRPVAAEVIARTTEESLNFGKRGTGDRLADTQLLVSYRGGPLSPATVTADSLSPGDRMPDIQGLRRKGLGFPFRLFDVLRGTGFVLLLPAGETPAAAKTLAADLHRRWPGQVRVAAVTSAGAMQEEPPGVEVLIDAAGAFTGTFGDAQAWLVRPDNYLGWCGPVETVSAALPRYLEDVITLKPAGSTP
ncbi:FAD-dependent monooxygenase [Chelatococcus asaccharovorans]|uniref:FAD-dependent monooxygenase n=1 Tax=Chelatococcus asaccharovorans TaxID=28210 RepID=UPI00224C75D3|nr:FAD-dependent monooxygenase [Chelatococcus asaccharovorans]CAH1652452.1 2-polyprenyl-6-methoxyphenol hydroxylase-like FAD-dependent oxidoreductase [Chelatococcus asaccharovorans]CAH1686333.1 2-polyprenyl-6-methoxyphenol hydroxylase-like FAD-dependent oxidoreductase [Chelatococcus asaccharovorans]